MKKIIAVTILLLSLTACQNAKEKQEEHDSKIAEQARAELLAELKKEKEEKIEINKDDKFSHLGITTTNGTLSINTNQTKAYFQDIADNIHNSVNKYKEDMKKGVINEKEAGIEVNKTHINIDLNKTKSFLNSWSKKLDVYFKDFKKLTTDIEKTIKNVRRP